MGAGFAEKRRALWWAVFCPEPEGNALGDQLGWQIEVLPIKPIKPIN
jgi:hypothetical protein